MHPLPVSPVRAWNGLFGEAYAQVLEERSKIHNLVLEERVDGPIRRKRTRVTTKREIPSAFSKILGSGPLTYEIEEEFEDTRQLMRWRVIPARMADKITAEGTYSIGPGPNDSSVRRVVGEVRVAIPLLGGQIEKLVAKELEAGYERSTAFAREWLLANG